MKILDIAKPRYKRMGKCIRCGACLNVCPVYRTIGGHSYLTTYQGPIGSVITPQLRDLKSWGHLASASSLCAACSFVCPVNIDIHHLLLENRWEMVREKHTGMIWIIALKIWAWIMFKRSRLNLFSLLARWTYRVFMPFLSRGKRKRIPDLPGKSFSHLWKKYEQQR